MTQLEQVVANSTRLSDRTKTIYLRAVQMFVEFAGNDWTGYSVERWRNELAQTRQPQTVNGYLAAIRYASRRLAELGGDPSLDFARYAETLKTGDIDTRRAVTKEQGAAIIAACDQTTPRGIRDRAICVLGFRTGLRRAGIAGIRFRDLNGNQLIVTLKGGRRHSIYLDQETMAALDAWRSWLAENAGITSGYLFRSVGREQLDGSVYIGNRITTDGIYKAVQKTRQRRWRSRISPSPLPSHLRHVVPRSGCARMADCTRHRSQD